MDDRRYTHIVHVWNRAFVLSQKSTACSQVSGAAYTTGQRHGQQQSDEHTQTLTLHFHHDFHWPSARKRSPVSPAAPLTTHGRKLEGRFVKAIRGAWSSNENDSVRASMSNDTWTLEPTWR